MVQGHRRVIVNVMGCRLRFPLEKMIQREAGKKILLTLSIVVKKIRKIKINDECVVLKCKIC